MTDKNEDLIQQLEEIYRQIENRVGQCITTVASWPCQKGCAGCCTRLAHLMEITKPEWDYLQKGLDQLNPKSTQKIYDRLDSTKKLQNKTTGFYQCPFLDQKQGSCRIYPYRPAACRIFGFYVGRVGHLWCESIELLYKAGKFETVILGNFDAVEQDLLNNFGKRQNIVQWYQQKKAV